MLLTAEIMSIDKQIFTDLCHHLFRSTQEGSMPLRGLVMVKLSS